MLKLFRASSSTAHIRYFVLEHLNEQWLYKICADKPPTVWPLFSSSKLRQPSEEGF